MMTATYSPDDNKLRLYSVGRLSDEDKARVHAAGFRWAPKQELWYAPAWSPEREDLLVELCGEVGDDDASLVERAEERAERFEGYEERRRDEAHSAREAASRIADGIPFGQPILVGHHSEKHARKDAERIENGFRRAVNLWKTAEYWQGRAASAIRHAKYKERPDVRARRIKTIEAERRKTARNIERTEREIKWWRRVLEFADTSPAPELLRAAAVKVANVAGGYDRYSRLTRTENPSDPTTEAREAIEVAERFLVAIHRWADHEDRRLDYERAMLGEQGGTVADKTRPEKGGAVRCWASHRGAWSWIVKVNRVSVSVFDNWGNGGPNFSLVIPFDKLGAVMSADGVAVARADGRIKELSDGTGFVLLDRNGDEPEKPAPAPEPAPEARDDRDGAAFEAMEETLRAGVQVVSAPALFPTPPDVARRLVELADLQPGLDILEPSAGTGRILDALLERGATGIVALEINPTIADGLRRRYEDARGSACVQVVCTDFLEWAPGLTFDRIVMNPPFTNGADIKHVEHARAMLKPGGGLVAIVADGPRQRAAFPDEFEGAEFLDAGTFAGTNVRAAILRFDGPEMPDYDCGISGCFHSDEASARACAESHEWTPATGRLF
jgi:phospholipid N-methyltransferase